MGQDDFCVFCTIMFEVPATQACAAVGDLDEARAHLAAAEESAARWEGTGWPAAVLEARASIAEAEGDAAGAARMRVEASALYEAAGSAAGCRALPHRCGVTPAGPRFPDLPSASADGGPGRPASREGLRKAASRTWWHDIEHRVPDHRPHQNLRGPPRAPPTYPTSAPSSGSGPTPTTRPTCPPGSSSTPEPPAAASSSSRPPTASSAARRAPPRAAPPGRDPPAGAGRQPAGAGGRRAPSPGLRRRRVRVRGPGRSRRPPGCGDRARCARTRSSPSARTG